MRILSRFTNQAAMSYRISLTQVRVRPRELHEAVCAAVHLLVRAHQYAAETRSNAWQFAVEIDDLLRLGVTRNELRWLVATGIAHHAREVREHSGPLRQFCTPGCASLHSDSCFILARDGLHKIARYISDAVVTPLEVPTAHPSVGQMTPGLSPGNRTQRAGFTPSDETPQWDGERRELRVDGMLVKQFRTSAFNQEWIIKAFHEEQWATRIDDPLPPLPARDSRRRLSDTIKCLNRHQVHELILFRGDGSGNGILWQPRVELRETRRDALQQCDLDQHDKQRPVEKTAWQVIAGPLTRN